MSYNLLSFFSESVISGYPILMKLTTLDVPFNTFIRLSSYFLVSLFFANYNILHTVSYTKLFALAITNIIHIMSSYYGFKALNPSLSESLFYTYPFINLLLTTIFLKENISLTKLLFIFPILFCIYNIYASNDESTQNFKLGIPMIVIAALTESILYILLKSTKLGNNPWNSILVVYGLAAIIYGVFYVGSYSENITNIVINNKKEVSLLILVNIIIGLFGYGLKFFTIPKVDSVTYSIITYTGIFVTLLLSYFFKIESLSITKVFYLFCLFVSLVGMHLVE